LQEIYPGFTPERKPQGYWKDKQNQKEFFDKLAIQLNIQKPEDWNHVTSSMVSEGRGFISNYYNDSVQQGNIEDIEDIIGDAKYCNGGDSRTIYDLLLIDLSIIYNHLTFLSTPSSLS
jgi:hypothetical protein